MRVSIETHMKMVIDRNVFIQNLQMSLARYRCIRELAPELSEKFPTIYCDLNSYFFELKLTSNVSDRFFRSLSTSQVNLKEIGQGHIFALSRDQVT